VESVHFSSRSTPLVFAAQCTVRACALVVVSIALLGTGGAPVAAAELRLSSGAHIAQGNANDVGSASLVAGLPSGSQVEQAVADAVYSTALPSLPALLAIPGDDRAGCNTDYLETTSAGCTTGDPNGTRTVVVWGDSHAWMWLPAFDAIGRSTQTQIVQFDKSSCAPPDMRIWLDRLRRPYTECDDFRRFVEARIAALHPDVVVLTGAIKGVRIVDGNHESAQGVDEAWATGLAATIHAVASSSGQIVVLGDIAYPVQEPADCLSAHANDFHVCDTPRSGSIDEFGLASGVFDDHNSREQQVAEQNGARFVSVTQWFCSDAVCPAIVGGLAVYRDYFHASPNYAYWLSNALAEATGLLR
jgi:hypothetical protein